jgi:hypothetical protein
MEHPVSDRTLDLRNISFLAAFASSRFHAATILAGTALALIVFLANYNWIVWHFYSKGAYLLDSGLLADLIWHNPSFNPRLADIVGGDIYNRVHFTPLFNLANALSYWIPIGRIEYYAIFQASVYSSLALVMFAFLCCNLIDKTAPRIFIAAIVALIFSFNGLVTSAIVYPHFEMLWPAMAFGFFWAMFSNHPALAIFYFVLALAVREDGGFHLFGFLALVIIVDLFRGVPLKSQNRQIAFAAAAFSYSVLALLVEKFVFSGAQLIAQEFVGKSPYEHLSIAYVRERFLENLRAEPWVAVTLLVATFFAIVDRRPAYLLGFLATAPWVMIYMLGPPGGYWLRSYRVFPLVLSMIWPVLDMARSQHFRLSGNSWRWCISYFSIVCIISIIVLNVRRPDVVRELAQGVRGYHANTAGFDAITRFLENPELREIYGRILVDDSVIALSPRGIKKSDSLRYGSLGDRIDVFIYWQGNRLQNTVPAILIEQGFPHGYRITGTNVLIASHKDMSRDQILSVFLQEEPAATKLFPYLFQIAPWAQISRDGVRVPPNAKDGLAVYGPYVVLASGSYEATFDVSLLTGNEQASITVDVVANGGSDFLARRDVTIRGSGGVQSVKLRFDIPAGSASRIELRVFPRRTGLIVKDVRCTRVNK